MDDLKEERDYLRAENAKLTEDLVRLKRFQTGMAEEPKAEKREIEPMPDPLRDYIDGIASPHLKRDIRGRTLRRHGRGETWASIQAEILEGAK